MQWLIALTFGMGTLADLSITGALLAVMYMGRHSHPRHVSCCSICYAASADGFPLALQANFDLGHVNGVHHQSWYVASV